LCHDNSLAPRRCNSLVRSLVRQAFAVGQAMEAAEDAARQGWLEPGEVRAARQRHGMADSAWDELVRIVQQHRQ
jgi:hypothetical protein